MKRGPVKDVTGQTFGRLTVVRLAGQSPRGVWKWLCVCSCPDGNQVEVLAGNLGRNTNSCGCLAKENIRRQWPKGVLKRIKSGSLARQLMGHYKQSADRRNLNFSLTEEQFNILIKQECYYCGVAPNQIYRPTRYESSLRYNGIDRSDNSSGYEFSNCVACCKNCNQMKSNLSKEEFFNSVLRIYNRHIAKDVE
jgi:hypothetical protein